MSGLGIPQEQIAKIIGISVPTLHKHFRDDLDVGKIRANRAVAANLFKIATGDGKAAVTAGTFWARTQMRWKETSVVEVQELPKIAVE